MAEKRLGTPMAWENLKMRLLKIVVAMDNTKITVVKTCRKNNFPLNLNWSGWETAAFSADIWNKSSFPYIDARNILNVFHQRRKIIFNISPNDDLT